jgi:hypothetical protein
MKRSSLGAIVLLVLLSGFTVVSPAAAEPRPGPALSPLATALERLWSLVSVVWLKNGCGLDPDGACAPAAPATTENGCWIDPSGVRRCEPVAPTTTKNGCRIDPDGVPRCEPAAPATIENGCGLDPSGACRQ